MKNKVSKFIFLLSIFLCSCFSLMAQTCAGKWETYNEKTGEKESIVEFYKKGEQLYGKIIKLYPIDGVDVNMLCDLCTDERKGKPVQGMEVFRELKWDGKMWQDGKALYPSQGKQYNIKIWLDPKDKDILKVRGYWGPFYATQTWKRVKA